MPAHQRIQPSPRAFREERPDFVVSAQRSARSAVEDGLNQRAFEDRVRRVKGEQPPRVAGFCPLVPFPVNTLAVGHKDAVECLLMIGHGPGSGCSRGGMACYTLTGDAWYG